MINTIAYFRNGLGNFILYTPVLQTLVELDNGNKIDLCIDSKWDDNRRESLLNIMNALPFVNKVISYPDENFSQEYKTYFWTRHTYPSMSMDFFRKKSPQFECGVAWQHSQIHEIDYYMNAVRAHFHWTKENPKQLFPVIEDNSFFNFPSGKLKIGLCNGSYGLLAGSKKWNKFKELNKYLKGFFECITIKLGYEDELNDVAADFDFVNKLSILQTGKIISQLDLLITVDTCNMHIADALNIPMIVIWGGSILSKNSPVNGTAKIIKTSLKCQPCHDTHKYSTCIEYSCLNKITVNDVMFSVREVLRDKN
jgi:ADP-heptose:LPS heptosyltransferase